MLSRDIWKHGSGWLLHDLLSSSLLTLLLAGSEGLPVYFASPWISDFVLFDNAARQVVSLFPDHADRERIGFIEFLTALSVRHEVRIITTANPTSDGFIKRLRVSSLSGSPHLKVRIAEQKTHEKGILAQGFYIDGSMNITHRGVHVNGEKISYHAAGLKGSARVAAAYLEFDRRWMLLEEREVVW